jgi:cytochrome c-type biogenesis protein CcmH
MTIWILFATMTAAAVMAVLWPLSRRPREAVQGDSEASFYRDQISEIDRDHARGLIDGAQAEAARAEAARRLLRSRHGATKTSDPLGEPALRRRRAASAIALSTVPLLSLAVYGAYGSPQLPAQPLVARQQSDPATFDLAQAVARIESHLASAPGDGRGWDVVAPVYMRAGRWADAGKAYRSAIAILGESPQRLIGFGEAVSNAAGGVVPVEARIAFERALVLEPGMPRAMFHLARAAEQDGDMPAARRRYEEIIVGSPADAAWVPMVRERLAALPGGAAAEAVATLPPGERDGAIRGMVEGLASRLDAQGGSGEEWARLIRARTVLGEKAKAGEVLARARAAHAGDAAELAKIDATARELALEAPR